MSAYKELQEKAKSLGIPYVGVSTADLEKAIQAKETPTPVQAPAECNTAVVLDQKREVRRYTLEGHGQSFAELAKAFAAKRGYTVELRQVLPGKRCPHCGALIE